MGTFIKSDFISTDTTAPKVTPIYASDSFTRADSATTAGSTEVGGYPWKTTDGGTASLAGGKLKLAKGSAATALVVMDDSRADGILTARLGTLAALSGIVFRVTGNTGYGLWTNGTNYELKAKTGVDAYGPALAMSPAQPATTAGDLLQVILKGSSTTVKINGTTVATFTDTTYTGTGKGFFVRNAIGTFDDFSWAPLP